jgi:hypothetical protein
MPSFAVYRQQRADGGMRTGVSLNGDTCAHHFEPGTLDDDPALEWYVDLRGEGDAVPATCAELMAWLPTLSAVVREGANAAADRLCVGLDPDAWPYQFPLPQALAGVHLVLATSAVRRITALSIADQIRDFGRDWQDVVAQVQSCEVAT